MLQRKTTCSSLNEEHSKYTACYENKRCNANIYFESNKNEMKFDVHFDHFSESDANGMIVDFAESGLYQFFFIFSIEYLFRKKNSLSYLMFISILWNNNIINSHGDVINSRNMTCIPRNGIVYSADYCLQSISKN